MSGVGAADGRPHTVSQAPVAVGAYGLTKRFAGGIVANDGVEFEALPGEIHGLLGENGSGKTTLCKMLTGLYRPDEGSLVVGGQGVSFASPADAYAHGIFMVHQHFSLVEQMSVAENIVLGWSPEGRFAFDHRAAQRAVRAASERFSMPVEPDASIWQLSVGERQRVEILRALYRGARTLILDEPTAVLTVQEVERLVEAMRKIASSGGTVIFISHKLNEVLTACDRVTVLRRGRTAGSADLRERGDGPAVKAHDLARMMVGRDVKPVYRQRHPPGDEPVVLSVSELVVHGDLGRPVVRGVSLQVHAGEIVGIAGVAGNGQRELAEAVCGVRAWHAGEVVVNGQCLSSGDALSAMRSGVAFVPEDRMGVGLAPGLTLEENLVLKSFRDGNMSVGPFMRRRAIAVRAEGLLGRFDVRGTADMLVRQLSGGNAQKVLLARELSSEPSVIVVAAPTRGLDVGAIATVRRLLLEAADAGVGVLLISEDLDELLDLADEIIVICHGEIMGAVSPEVADREEIGLWMMGERAA